MQKSTRLRSVQSLVLLLALVLLAGIARAIPNTDQRSQIPEKYKWRVNDIYPDWDAWEKGYSDLEGKINDFKAFKGTLANSPETLLECYQSTLVPPIDVVEVEYFLSNALGRPQISLYRGRTQTPAPFQ